MKASFDSKCSPERVKGRALAFKSGKPSSVYQTVRSRLDDMQTFLDAGDLLHGAVSRYEDSQQRIAEMSAWIDEAMGTLRLKGPVGRP